MHNIIIRTLRESEILFSNMKFTQLRRTSNLLALLSTIFDLLITEVIGEPIGTIRGWCGLTLANLRMIIYVLQYIFHKMLCMQRINYFVV